MADIQVGGDLGTSTITLNPITRESYNKNMLRNAYPELVFSKYANKYSIPKGEGRVANWHRVTKFAVPQAPLTLTESVTPPAIAGAYTRLNVTVNQYGAWTGVSDRFDVESIDPVLMRYSAELGKHEGQVLDIVTRNGFLSGTNVAYAAAFGTTTPRTARANIAAADIVNDFDIKRIARILARQNTPRFKEGTSEYFVMIVHPDVYFDMMSLDAWKYPGYYADPKAIYTGTVKMLLGVLVVPTTQVRVTNTGASSAPIYENICFGMDALGEADIEALASEMIVKSTGGTDDPLNQRKTAGWKATHASRILIPEFVVRYECSATQ
jgi:N4-gp56 family major capsid protein